MELAPSVASSAPNVAEPSKQHTYKALSERNSLAAEHPVEDDGRYQTRALVLVPLPEQHSLRSKVSCGPSRLRPIVAYWQSTGVAA